MTIRYETEEYKGYWLSIVDDEYPENPRDWDNLGTMVCAHRRYRLGDRMIGDGGDTPYVDNPTAFATWINSNMKEGKIVALPLYLYDHGGITMSTSTFYGRVSQGHAEFDSGLVGFIYVTRDQIKKQFGWKNLSPKRIKRIVDILKDEVEIYDSYIIGLVYGYEVWLGKPDEPDSERLDSCYGYYSIEDARMDAKNSIDYEVKQDLKRGVQLILPGMEEQLPDAADILHQKME